MKASFLHLIALQVLLLAFLLGPAEAVLIQSGATSVNSRFTNFAGLDFSQNPNYVLDGFNLSGLPFDSGGESYIAISSTHVLRSHQTSGNPLTFDIGGVLVDRTIGSSVNISYAPTAGANDIEMVLMTLSAPIDVPQVGDPVYDPTLFQPLPILVSPASLAFVPPAPGSWPITAFSHPSIGTFTDPGFADIPLVVTGQGGVSGTEVSLGDVAIASTVAGTGDPFDFFGLTDTLVQTAGEAKVASGDSDEATVAIVGGTPITDFSGRITGYSGGTLAAFGSNQFVSPNVPFAEINGFTLPGYYLPQLTAEGATFTTILAPAIPEPSRSALIAAGLGLLLLRRRRRRE